MRPYPLAVLPLFALVACSSSSGDAGGGGGAAPASGFSYAPEACGYQVTVDDTTAADRVYALDDGSLGSAPQPKRVRLGLGGSTTLGEAGYADPSKTVAIVWDTDVDTKASKVMIGKSADALTDAHAGFSFVLPGSVPTRVHQVHVCGGDPSSTLYYKVGGGPAGQEVWGPVQSFTLAPASGAGDSYKVGVSGDSRDSLDVIWPLVQGRMKDAAPRFQGFTGDSIPLALANSEDDYGTWFDGAWKSSPASAGGDLSLGNMPIYAIGGNHENLQAQWLANFAFPGSQFSGFFFSFDSGAAHFVFLDDNAVATNMSGSQPGAADAIKAFLAADLAAADARRATVPWVVVLHHRGELSTSNHADDADVALMRKTLMPLWDQYHVDLVLNGHDHNYERSKPANWDGSAPAVASDPKKGTTYIVCAGAGAGGYSPGDGTAPYSAVRVGFNGGGSPYVGVYGLLDVSSAALGWTAYGLKPSGTKVADDDVIDTVSLTK